MANWQMTLDFSKEKDQYENGEITIKQLAVAVVSVIKSGLEKAKKIDENMGAELEQEILPMFEEIAEGDEKYYDVNALQFFRNLLKHDL